MTIAFVERCVSALVEHHQSIAFAESATAGRLASEFALAEQAGKCLLGGLVCYDACIKENVLNVPKALIEQYTAESAEVTQAITQNLAQYFEADILVGITGLIAPGGSETPEKPVGTMFIHMIVSGKNFAYREVFSGSPEQIMLKTIERVAQLLLSKLEDKTNMDVTP